MATILLCVKLLENKNVVLFTDNLDIVQIWTSESNAKSHIMITIWVQMNKNIIYIDHR